MIFVHGWLFVGMYARHRVAEVKAGAASRVAVRFNGANADFPEGASSTWSYLGAVSGYVFVYDHEVHAPLILPVNAIASLRPSTRAAAPASADPVAARR